VSCRPRPLSMALEISHFVACVRDCAFVCVFLCVVFVYVCVCVRVLLFVVVNVVCLRGFGGAHTARSLGPQPMVTADERRLACSCCFLFGVVAVFIVVLVGVVRLS